MNNWLSKLLVGFITTTALISLKIPLVEAATFNISGKLDPEGGFFPEVKNGFFSGTYSLDDSAVFSNDFSEVPLVLLSYGGSESVSYVKLDSYKIKVSNEEGVQLYEINSQNLPGYIAYQFYQNTSDILLGDFEDLDLAFQAQFFGIPITPQEEPNGGFKLGIGDFYSGNKIIAISSATITPVSGKSIPESSNVWGLGVFSLGWLLKKGYSRDPGKNNH